MKRLTVLFCVVLAFFMVAESAFAEKVLGRKEYTDRQTFHAPVKFRAPVLGNDVVVEGATEDAYETTMTFTEPTSDNIITVPDATGTIGLVGGKSLSSTVGYTAGTGMSISAADIARYTTFYVNVTSIGASCSTSIGPSDGTGVTVVLAVPTAAIDGKPITFINTTGTTDFFLYVTGGLPIDTTTGTTDVLTADAEGDAITVIPRYNSAVSYYIQSYRIH